MELTTNVSDCALLHIIQFKAQVESRLISSLAQGRHIQWLKAAQSCVKLLCLRRNKSQNFFLKSTKKINNVRKWGKGATYVSWAVQSRAKILRSPLKIFGSRKVAPNSEYGAKSRLILATNMGQSRCDLSCVTQTRIFKINGWKSRRDKKFSNFKRSKYN